MWLTTDKFVENPLERNILQDMLGGRMSLIHEYGENKYQIGKDEGIEKGKKEGIEKGKKEGIKEENERIVTNLLKSGNEAEVIAKQADIPLEKVLKIKNKNNL